MRGYVDEICEMTPTNGLAIELGKISLSRGYHDGAVVAPLDFELDEFSGV
jgi:hypothetical protein